MSDAATLEARLRQVGAERYHDKHPFHHLLHSGGCTIDQVRAWVVNRYYYQSRIPMTVKPFAFNFLAALGKYNSGMTPWVLKEKTCFPSCRGRLSTKALTVGGNPPHQTGLPRPIKSY